MVTLAAEECPEPWRDYQRFRPVLPVAWISRAQLLFTDLPIFRSIAIRESVGIDD
jgi:hypothetical protein